MAAFNATNKAPGVYIEEVQVPGPIAGVGTSTAAFVGPAERGLINKPTFLTNWTQFQNTFGDYIFAPMVYVTHAVRGFFENGGSSCYFTRVGTAVRASQTLLDRQGKATLIVTAKEEGYGGNSITVEVEEANIVSEAKAFQVKVLDVAAASSEKQVTMSSEEDAKKFRPGDIIFFEEGEKSERATIERITGKILFLEDELKNSYEKASLRIADLQLGQQKIRLNSITGFEARSYINIKQGDTDENCVVQGVDKFNQFIILTKGLSKEYDLSDAEKPVKLKTLEFTIKVDGGITSYENLSLEPNHSRYFNKHINSPDVVVEPVDPPSPSVPPDNLPKTLIATNLTGGEDDNIAGIVTEHYIDALGELERVDEVNMVCIPDGTKEGIQEDVQNAIIDHCEKMQDRFAILDPVWNGGQSNGIENQRDKLGSDRGYGALYYPWIEISNPAGNGRIMVPPSGHIAGVYARVDSERGVHKAPANEALRSVLGLELKLKDDEQGPLNESGVNVIRSFPGRGPVVWGARTISSSTQWRYVNVRRLLLYIEESIQEGTQFAVFEPNNLELWQKVKRQVSDFLTRVWRDGALFGATPDQAFRVRIDEELNPPSVRALGQLIIEVVLYPTTPAEFVVFRVIQQPGGPTVQE